MAHPVHEVENQMAQPRCEASATFRSRPRRARASGFSAIEMVVAIGLSLAVSAIAVPSGSKLFRQYQFGSAINRLASDMARARIQAVAQNRFVRVRFLDQTTYTFERSTDGVTFSQYGGQIKLPPSVTASGGGPTFDRSGLPAAVTTMSLTDGSVSKGVRVNVVGSVSIL
jgi:Tfp pilus assembly protein FimT